MRLRVISLLETIASVIGLIYSLRPGGGQFTAGQGMLIGLVVASFAVIIALEIKEYMMERPHSFKNEKKINDYMYQWISQGRRVAIFTRDMSWANEDRFVSMLALKAKRDELTIYLPKRTSFTDELEQAGAKIITYEYLGFTPQSRFTIINKGKMDSCIAVGRRVQDQHIVEEYRLGENHVFTIADDLLEVLERFNDFKKAAKNEKA